MNVTPILCVAALIACGPRVALIRSKKPGRSWEVPGGKAKPGETWRQAMTREIEEEIGMFVPPADWTVVDVLCGEPVPGAQFASTIIVARVETSGPHPLRAGDDAAAADWFTRSTLPGDLSDLQTREVIERWARGTVGAPDKDVHCRIGIAALNDLLRAEQWLRRGELTTAETRAHEGHLFRLSRRLLHEVALWRVGAPRCSTCKRDHHPKDPCQD